MSRFQVKSNLKELLLWHVITFSMTGVITIAIAAIFAEKHGIGETLMLSMFVKRVRNTDIVLFGKNIPIKQNESARRLIR